MLADLRGLWQLLGTPGTIEHDVVTVTVQVFVPWRQRSAQETLSKVPKPSTIPCSNTVSLSQMIFLANASKGLEKGALASYLHAKPPEWSEELY